MAEERTVNLIDIFEDTADEVLRDGIDSGSVGGHFSGLYSFRGQQAEGYSITVFQYAHGRLAGCVVLTDETTPQLIATLQALVNAGAAGTYAGTVEADA